MQESIAITALSSLSPLGNNSKEVWDNYLQPHHFIQSKSFGTASEFAATLSIENKHLIEQLRKSDSKYKSLDDTVLMAIWTSRQAVLQANWKDKADFGINMGSSRGATTLFENHFQEFLETGKAQTLASPTTTLGNISSWVAHDLQSEGPELSHSITCSTGLHAVLNGVAWLRAGMADAFLVGGSEAPLTPFTIAQMKAMKIYAFHTPSDFPCRALDFTKTRNSMVLGEGAASVGLELGKRSNALAYITGIGYATEVLQHGVSVSTEAECFKKSMKMALKNSSVQSVDAIVMHAPGTMKGDSSEYKAIQHVFGESLPLLTTNKWKTGHTFATSGLLSMELGLLMMQHNQFIPVPFGEKQHQKKDIKTVLINSVGFGGNAVSILMELDI
ncbi:beta-ketoacyl synthase N-terminal-like domain-containing protein [Flavobacterium tegetincola]|uniref:beta-ketoacyl synthase N-terminal-like domain-containing protein n=1 Tax=Flavobacterium tegetincola TaxID=150172 RepID=UPI00042A91E1|nr:beta-ketoacyl synthase N-terminal-like domain-containing protein [Flavobacterium tegetincola]